jgi:hypothetical protein
MSLTQDFDFDYDYAAAQPLITRVHFNQNMTEYQIFTEYINDQGITKNSIRDSLIEWYQDHLGM